MMRSLFSGVAGLRTHQTRMDVIGNNIANVNTTAYKSQSMVFTDLLYQTTQAASGANANTGRGGVNPRQIGLGARTGAISTAIATQGSAQSTNNPWDIMIDGEAFFVVSDGSSNFFTRDGSFTVDGAGNLVMATTGYTVMGWQVDPETGEIRSDVVSALRIMHPDNLTAPPEATSLAYMSGILDATDTDISSTRGAVRTLKIFDALGYEYTALFSVHATSDGDQFRVQLDDIQDSDGVSLVKKYGLRNIDEIASFGSTSQPTTTSKYNYNKGEATFTAPGTFNLNMALSSILKDYSSNSLIVAAGDTVTVKAGTTAGDKKAGTDKITVTGSVSLTQAELESAPYNLIYNTDKKKYETKDASGKTVTIGDDATDGMTWANALKAMKGLENVSSPTVTPDSEDPSKITISFEAEYDLLQDANFDGKTFNVTLTYPTDEAKILSQVYHLEDGDNKTYKIDFIGSDGSAQIIMTENATGNMLVFDHDSGKFSYIGNQGSNTAMLTFKGSASSLTGEVIDLSQFSNIDIDFSSITNFGNGGKSTLEMTNGSKENSALGSGRKVGELIGIEVGQDGRITASYDNGLTKLLGQIAVASFANASGLSKVSNNLYTSTQNSGEFDGVGSDITALGGSMTSGVLEMSNVDLSQEFTTMITTQRGFQANSRIITVSDTMLEELVNLKR